MNEEIIVDLAIQQWNLIVTMVIALAIFGGCLCLMASTFIRNIDDGVIGRLFSYIMIGFGIVIFGFAGYFHFGGFYL